MAARQRCCGKCGSRSMVICSGCSGDYCRNHWLEHEQDLSQQLGSIEFLHNLFRDKLNDEKTHPDESAGMKKINQWEEDTVRSVQQRAKELRKIFVQHRSETIDDTDIALARLTEQISDIRQENIFNEIDLDDIRDKFNKLQDKFNKLYRISLQTDSTSSLDQVVTHGSSDQLYSSIDVQTDPQWNPNGLTVAGGNGEGGETNQLNLPRGICVDDVNQTIYIADAKNNRIVQWDDGGTCGRIMAAGNQQVNPTNRLSYPVSVVLDQKNHSIIVCDRWHDRVVSWWSCPNITKQYTIIRNCQCWGLMVDMAGDLYISDTKRHEVRRWRQRETDGEVVAGGYGVGNHLNQLHHPTYIFVDHEYSVYIADSKNDRVMKWKRDAKQGSVVAGGNGKGDSLTQLDDPQGVLVDRLGNVYVGDHGNDRVMCWSNESRVGRVVAGGNGKGNQANQFNGLAGLAFDREGNLFVVDHKNHRVQKFTVTSHRTCPREQHDF